MIVDSAEAHNESWEAMAREFEVEYDGERDFRGIFGRHNTDIISSLWGVSDPTQIERMAGSKEGHFRRAAVHLKPLPGVVDLMLALKEDGWRQGIGSSAPLENIRILLETSGTREFIYAIASGDDVREGKPDPEVFLIALERLGILPHQAVVIEDAPAGIKAALRAGAAALGVTTTQTRETLEGAGAHLVVGSLAEVGVESLETLIRINAAISSRRAATETAD